MKEQLLQLFREHAETAFLISFILSILVAVVGILPSFFITAANILFFGFLQGILISFLGEAVGAMVAFLLYRKGFKKPAITRLNHYPRIQQLLLAEKREAFLLIFSLRLLPFIPSGMVTFAAAVGRVSAILFFIASSLGKVPALFLEGYTVYQVSNFGWQGKIFLAVAAMSLAYFAIKQIWQGNKGNQ